MKWIKIKDKLPEPFEDCLFFSPNYEDDIWVGWMGDLDGDNNRAWYHLSCDGEKSDSFSRYCGECNRIPTRWIPIPNRPRKRTNEEKIISKEFYDVK